MGVTFKLAVREKPNSGTSFEIGQSKVGRLHNRYQVFSHFE